MNISEYEQRLAKRTAVTNAQAGSAAKEIILVAGARPNFIKLAPLYKELSRRSKTLRPVVLHTGQHYDQKMSDVFFQELGLPEPDIFLGAGSGTHAEQTARIMIELEIIFAGRSPDLVVVFGDVNSTLAASITAAKMGIPLAHVEAGLRAFDRSMPEEINRLVTDTLSDLLLTPSLDANRNLEREGVPREKIKLVGNIMIDTLAENLSRADKSDILERLQIKSGGFALMTMHRPGNVDDKDTVEIVLDIVEGIAAQHTIVFPIHPRTYKNFSAMGGRAGVLASGSMKNVIVTEPLGYLDFLKLQKESAVTLTDSGGVQEETTYLGVPCLTLRPNTERPVTITHGSNHLIGLDAKSAIDHAQRFLRERSRGSDIPPLWDGRAAVRIADAIESFLFEGDYKREMNTLHIAAREDALQALRQS